jgi:hypothetical protein
MVLLIFSLLAVAVGAVKDKAAVAAVVSTLRFHRFFCRQVVFLL